MEPRKEISVHQWRSKSYTTIYLPKERKLAVPGSADEPKKLHRLIDGMHAFL